MAGRLAGADVRKCGSGNIGATNVLRVLGKKYGFAVFFADAAKGFIAIRIAESVALRNGTVGFTPGVVAAIFAVIGHSFPVWLRFRGGKGVATSAGAWFGLVPLAAIATGLVWLLTFFSLRFVSVASLAAACALPLTVWLLSKPDSSILYFALLTTVLVIARHRTNIQRLMNGTEPRFERK